MPDSVDQLRARMVEAELIQGRLAFAYHATATLLGMRRGPRAVAETLAQICVPDLADWALVTLGHEYVAAVHFDPAKQAIAASVSGSMLSRGASGPMRVLATGESELMTQVPRGLLEQADSRTDAHLALLDILGARSFIVVPLVAAGVVRGTLSLVAAESERRYGHDDLAFAADLASRAALVIENASVLDAERTARAQAEAATRTRDDLLAIVSHDLRSPLEVITLAASLLKVQADPAHQRRIDMVLRSSDKMKRLIADLLDFAALQSGGLAIELGLNDLRDILKDASETFTSVAAAKQIQLATTIEDPELTIRCDRDRVAQVIGNLVGNALKFTLAGGHVTIAARQVGASAEISVADTGPGIPTADLPHIFDRYWQAQRTGRLGVGLGLSISKGLVEAHGGRIWAESLTGQGTTFRFVLPLAR